MTVPDEFTMRQKYRAFYMARIVAGRTGRLDLEDALMDALFDIHGAMKQSDKRWTESARFDFQDE